MTTPSLGIDMAARTFVAALWFEDQRFSKAEFTNDARGFRQLQTWLKRHGLGALRVALESTSTYGEALARWLHEAGHTVHLLNPERVAHFGRSLGQRNKTDPADAVTIARFIAVHRATPWQPPAPEQRTLRSLTRVRHQLIAQRVQLDNQLKTAEPAAAAHLRPIVQTIREELARIDRQIAAHLRAHPALAAQVRRLRTVKGVGWVTAAIVLAELPPVTADTDPRALCAWAGLTPRRWQSGKLERPARLSRKGNAYLRDALYMPALVAKRFNPLLRDFGLRLAANGKSSAAILGAIAHKMLRILVGLLRTNTDFDPTWSPNKT